MTCHSSDQTVIPWNMKILQEICFKKPLIQIFCRGAQACVLAFSCVDRESFKCVAKWKKKVEEECGNIPMVLVMTKLDLLYRAEVDSFEVEKLSRQLGIRLIKTSVKENINVHKVGTNS